MGRIRLPYYWFLADQGVLSDNYFTSQMGQSFPNHLYLLAAMSGGCISHPDLSGNFDVLDSLGAMSSTDHLSAAQVSTPLPVFLEARGLTWTVFQELDDTPILNLPTNALLDLSASVKDIDVIRQLPDFHALVWKAGVSQPQPVYCPPYWDIAACRRVARPDPYHS